MNEILIANLTLDTTRKNNIPTLVVPQGDYGARMIRSKITDLGKPVIVESTAAVSIVATRSGDGESQAFSGSVNADGTVTVPVTQWMLDVPEEDVTCHIVVTGIGYQYSTTSFLIEPQEKANPTEISEDDPRVDVVTEVLAGENTRRAAETERVENENARIAAENARQSAEEQRVTDEATRITNEAQRVSAESSRDATFRSWAQDIASLPTFDGRINANRKRIENLESGIPAESFIIDDSVAYTKDVPENIAPNAVVQKVGGMTRKCTNLFNFELWKATAVTDRATVTYGDNSVTVSAIEGDAFVISEAARVMVKGGETYTISFVESNTAVESVHYLFKNGKIDSSMKVFYGSPYTFVADADAEYYTVRFGVSNAGSTITFSNIMLNEGEAKPYEPYFEGLRSAKVTEVKSVGVNLLPFPYNQSMVTNNGVTYTVNADGSVLANGTATEYTNAVIYLARNFVLPAGTYTFVFNETVIQGAVMAVMINGAWFANVSTHRTITLKSGDALTIYLQVVGGVSVTNLLLKPRINKGATAQPYTPYVEHTLPIPEAVRPANGINENAYDFIEWAEDGSVKSHKMVEKVVLDGSDDENWSYNSPNNLFYIVNPFKRASRTLCDKLPTDTILRIEKDGLYTTPEYSALYLNLPSVSSIENSVYHLRAWLAENPLTVIGELAEPIVTDISDLITADNLIGVEGGGTLTFENEYGYAVPSTIIYQLR